jgi:hypothetical protein
MTERNIMDNQEVKDSVYVNDDSIYNKKIKNIDPPKRDIGIDTEKEFLENIVQAGLSSYLDMAKI